MTKLATTLGSKKDKIQSLEILETFKSRLEIQIHQQQIADIWLSMVLTLIKLIALSIHIKEGWNNFEVANHYVAMWISIHDTLGFSFRSSYICWQRVHWNELDNFGDSAMTFDLVGSELFRNGGNADGFCESYGGKG